jgi:hypothetical protein
LLDGHDPEDDRRYEQESIDSMYQMPLYPLPFEPMTLLELSLAENSAAQ